MPCRTKNRSNSPPTTSPPLLPAIPYNPLFAIRDDAGPFVTLGRAFNCNKSRWIGSSVISPTAIYLLKKSKNNSSSYHAYGGGLVGAMLSSALSKEDQLATCTAADLPDSIRAQLDPKKKLAAKSVIIIPLTTVSMVATKRFIGSLTFFVGADKFVATSRSFRFSSTLKKISALGWSLNTDLNPTDAPVHDTRSDEERANPTRRPLWQRILLTIGAILLILLLIAIRILARLQ